MDIAEQQQSMTWIKQIPGDLFQLDQAPLLGYPPPFDWKQFGAFLEEKLHLKGLSVKADEWRWRTKEELFDGLGDHLKSTTLTLTPLAGSIFWIMPEAEISKLIRHLFLKQNTQGNDPLEGHFTDEDFKQIFYRFLTLEIIHSVEKTLSDKELSLSLAQNESLPFTHCLCQDITLSLTDSSLRGRLFLTPEFRTSWMQRYLKGQNNAAFQSPLSDKLSLMVHLEAGKVNLSASEWKKIKVGDCLLLDSCSLSPDEDKGRIHLVINGTPFFRAKVKQGNIKILEHPLYHEVNTVMNPPPKTPADDEEEDLFNDSEFDAELDSVFDEDNSHSQADADISSFDEFDIEEGPELKEKNAKPKQAAPSSKQPEQTQAAKKETATPAAQASAEKNIASIEEIPLTITVEVGRLQMSIKKILELQPGNMLDLNIHPEAGVDLILNGKCLAKGELLRIGDTLGVRIVDLS